MAICLGFVAFRSHSDELEVCGVLAAERLLEQAGWSVETAVALFFSSQQGPFPPEHSDSPVAQLRAILGPSITSTQASRLLERAHNSLQEAIDLYYTAEGDVLI